MKKITILYIDIEGGFGGSSKSLFTMVSSINLDKYAPIVFCKKRGPIYEKLINKGIKCYIEPSINSIIPLRKNNIKNWLAHAPKFLFIKKLVKRIVDLNPDILHLNYEGLVPLHYLLIKNKFCGKTVLHFRSSLAPANFVYKIYANHINKHMNFLVFVSENEKNIANKAGVNIHSIPNTVLYNCTTTQVKTKINKNVGSKYLNIIFIGLLSDLKGSSRLIDLADFFKSWESPIKIKVFGGSPRDRKFFFFQRNKLQELRLKVKKKQLENWIEFCGHTNYPERELLKADILIRPSRLNDPWGRDIIEAFSLGVPVISHGSYDKFLKNNITGLLLPEWDTYKYANSLRKLASNKEIIKQWSVNASIFANKNFNTNNYSKKIMSIYSTLYEKK